MDNVNGAVHLTERQQLQLLLCSTDPAEKVPESTEATEPGHICLTCLTMLSNVLLQYIADQYRKKKKEAAKYVVEKIISVKRDSKTVRARLCWSEYTLANDMSIL